MNKICIIVCAVSTQKDYILWWGLSVEPLSKNWPRFSAQQYSSYQKMLLCWKCAIDFVVVNNRSKTSANSQSLYISPAVNNFYQNFSGATQGVRPVRMRYYHDFSKYNMAVAAAAYNPVMVAQLKFSAILGSIPEQCTTCIFGKTQSCYFKKLKVYETKLYTGSPQLTRFSNNTVF